MDQSKILSKQKVTSRTQLCRFSEGSEIILVGSNTFVIHTIADTTGKH